MGTGGIAGGSIEGLLLGDAVTAIENDAWNRMCTDLYNVYKHLEEGTVAINIVGFSRGGAEALDFANRVEGNIQNGSDFSFPWVNPTNDVVATGVRINFLGLFDPVDSIDAKRDNPGILRVTVPAGIAHVADAVAFSENRYLFDWIDLGSQDTPTFTALGFMGAHSDIGGGYVNDPIANETISWMTGQAKSAGMVFTTTFPSVAYTAADVHDSYMLNMGGFNPIPMPPIERSLPGGLLVDTSGGYVQYGTQLPGFWNPDFAGDANSYNEYWKFIGGDGW